MLKIAKLYTSEIKTKPLLISERIYNEFYKDDVKIVDGKIFYGNQELVIQPDIPPCLDIHEYKSPSNLSHKVKDNHHVSTKFCDRFIK